MTLAAVDLLALKIMSQPERRLVVGAGCGCVEPTVIAISLDSCEGVIYFPATKDSSDWFPESLHFRPDLLS